MSINQTNEMFHNQRLKNSGNNTSDNYANGSFVSGQTQDIIKQNNILQNRANVLNVKLNEAQENRFRLQNFDANMNKQLFAFFKKIIAELESSIEVLKIIAAENPELFNNIKTKIQENAYEINNSERRDIEIDYMLKRVFEGKQL